MKNVDSRSDLERQYDTGMLPECDLPKLIKTLKQERDSMLFNWKQAEKENKRLTDCISILTVPVELVSGQKIIDNKNKP